MQQEMEVQKPRRKWVRGVKIGLLVYCSIGIAAYYLQEKFFFHPATIEANKAYKISQPHREVIIPYDSRTNYSLIQFTTRDTAKGVVLYFHGNQDNAEHYAANAPAFTSKGYEVWMVDYPGFGKSTGTLTEAALYQQALEVYKMARVRFAPGDIVIYGRSLGSGIATQLASIRDCKSLVLETPYYSFTSLARRFLWMYPVDQMMKYKFPTYSFLEKVTAPVTICHGTDDGVIPFSNAKRLEPILKPQDEFVTVEGGSHNDLSSSPQLRHKIDSLLSAPPMLLSAKQP